MAVEPRLDPDPAVARAVEQYLEQHLDERVEAAVQRALAADPAKRTCRIISSKGTMDMAFPPLILASTAAALGMDTAVFFTFYGLELLKKNPRLKVDPIGNPAMPMPVPNLVAALPGMRDAATWMMSGMFKKHGVSMPLELREVCVESGVRLVACQMTMEVMGVKPEELIDGIEFGGAAAFLHEASRAHVTLFV